MKSKLVQPMLASLVKEPVDRPGWVYEEKYDGDRAIAYRRGGHPTLMSRSLKDITAKFPEIAQAIESLPDGNLILDGEIVVFDRHGVSRFQLLQRRATGEAIRPVYAVFDCIECAGRGLAGHPLHARRKALEDIVPERSGVLMRARRLAGDGRRAYATACRKGWEGIVAKDEDSPYEPGARPGTWLKVKCRKQSEFVVGGFTAPTGKRSDFGAILVGLYEGNRLRYTGKIGTGFSRATLRQLGTAMRGMRAKQAAFDPVPHENEVTWIEPRLVAEAAFTEWTRDGKLRQPIFLGIRHDKKPDECTWAEREE